jgi:hypothetical protein
MLDASGGGLLMLDDVERKTLIRMAKAVMLSGISTGEFGRLKRCYFCNASATGPTAVIPHNSDCVVFLAGKVLDDLLKIGFPD